MYYEGLAKWALAHLSNYPTQGFKHNILNINSCRKHRPEFNKNGFESGYDGLRKNKCIFKANILNSKFVELAGRYSLPPLKKLRPRNK